MNEILIPENILNELSFLYNSKKFNDLKLRLETLLSVYPNSSLLWNIEGAVKKSLQLFDEAEFAFKKVVEINPKNGVAHNNLAVAYFNEKQYDLAEQHSILANGLGQNMTSLLNRIRVVKN